MLHFRILTFLALFLLTGIGRAVVYAEFTTNRKNGANQPLTFKVILDTQSAPLAVTHFSLLAGKEDDVWHSGGGARLPVIPIPGQSGAPMQLAYETSPGTLENLLVYAIAESESSSIVKEYLILTAGQYLELGRVNAFPSGDVYEDVSGKDRIEMWQDENFPYLWRVKLKYPRPWVEPIFGLPTEDPYYQDLAVSSFGGRMFAGTRTIGGKEVTEPGYTVPDELVKVPNVLAVNPEDYYREPFNVPYVLAMDNDGPNTNGVRFFITGISEPENQEWNRKYTAFGYVDPPDRAFVSELISRASSNPGTVSITSIEIKKRAPFTVGFFEGYYQNFLPGSFTNQVELSMRKVNGKPELLAFSPQDGTSESASLLTQIYASNDLVNYSLVDSAGIAAGVTEPVQQFLNANLITSPRSFFRATGWEYPLWPSATVSLENAIFEFSVDDPEGSSGELTLLFNLEGTGGTFVDSTQIVRSEIRNNPDWFPGSEEFPIIVIDTLHPEVPSVRNGTFEAEYFPSQGPYAGTIEIKATSGELEIDHIELLFSFNPQEYQSALLNAPVPIPYPNRYRAYKDEPDFITEEGGRLLPFEYEGYYLKPQ